MDSENFLKNLLKQDTENIGLVSNDEYFGLIAIPIETEESLRKRFGIGVEGPTHHELVNNINDKPKKKYKPRENPEPKLPLDELSRIQFEKSLSKEKTLVDFHGLNKIQEYLTKNEYTILSFICKAGINNATPFPCIKEEEWIKGVKNNYDVYAQAPKVKVKSRYNAIDGLIDKKIIYRNNFKDNQGIFYFLNTQNALKILDLVNQNKLNRDDLERLNQLLKNRLLDSLDPEFIQKFLQYRSEKFSDLILNIFRKDEKYFQEKTEMLSDQNQAQNKSDSNSQDSLPIDHPISSLKGKIDRSDPILKENPREDFFQKEMIDYLTDRLICKGKTIEDLRKLISDYTLEEVYIETQKLEERNKSGKKIGSLFHYLETTLENKQKKELKSRQKAKKQDSKVKNIPEQSETFDIFKFIPVIKAVTESVYAESGESDINSLVNKFTSALKDFTEGSRPELEEHIQVIKKDITSMELKSILLLVGTESEAEIIINFLRNF